MSTHLTYELTYPKPIAQAWADLKDPAFQEGKMRHAGTRDPKVTITPREPDSVYIELERDNPVVGVPSAVKRLTGEWQHVVERMTWGPDQGDGTRVAEHETEFVGLPLHMRGTLTLRPNGEVTTLVLDSDFKSSVPLIGGKLESTAANETKASMDSEAEFSGQFPG